MNTNIFELAASSGFSDARVIPFSEAAGLCPHNGGYESVLALFLSYSPVERAKAGEAALSNYYPASHAAYHKAKELARRTGLAHAVNVNLKALAAKTGGFIGKNGLYYHEELGSFVVIQALLSREKLPERRGRGAAGCGDCELCIAACPMDALRKGVPANCLRALMGKNPPDVRARGQVFQLLGCEICQEVCPKNVFAGKTTGHAYPLDRILQKDVLEEIQQLCGKNMARTNVLLAQAACIAANQGARELLPNIEALSAEPLLAEVMKWALDNFEVLGYNLKTPY